MKQHCLIYLLINAVVYLLSFIIYQLKKRQIDIGTIILAAWNIGSWGAVYYYTFEVAYLSYYKVTLFPLIYLFIANYILFKPFLITDYSKISRVKCNKLNSAFKAISIFFAIVGILPFFNVLFKLSSFSLLGAALADMYTADEDKTTLIFSPAIRPFYSILRHFVPFIIFLFFYNLTIRKRNRLVILGLGFNIITFFSVSLLSGSRGGIMSLLISCSFYFLFMKGMFGPNIYRAIKIIGITVVAFIIIGISAISISRLADMSNSKGRELLMDQWLSQYAGEGIVRFDNTIWNLDNHLYGYQNLPYLFSFFDAKTKDLDKMADRGEAILNTPVTVFYTYLGDLVIDFGLVGGLIVVYFTGLIIKALINTRYNEISFYRLIILNYFFTYISIGFTANIYRTYYTQTPIVYILILLGLLYLFQTFAPKKYIKLKKGINKN